MQSLQLKVQPAQLNYSPDGKTVLFTTSLKLLNGLTYGKQGDETKEQWHLWDKESVSVQVSAGLVVDSSTHHTIDTRFHCHIQSRRRRACLDAFVRSNDSYPELSLNVSCACNPRTRGWMCCGCARPAGQVGISTASTSAASNGALDTLPQVVTTPS